MSKTTFLTRSDVVGSGLFDSVEWAMEVHAKKSDCGQFNSAVLHGNEDCPERIDFYRSAEPDYDDSPDWTWEDDGRTA